MIKIEHMLKQLEELNVVTDSPTFTMLFRKIREELVDDIAMTAAKSSGRGKELAAARNILKSARKIVDKAHCPEREYCCFANVVGGVQYFTNACMLVGLNEGNHLPLEPYVLKPGERTMEFAALLNAGGTCGVPVEIQYTALITSIKEWAAKGKKKLVYSFGEGDFPMVDAQYLKWAVEALGGDVKCCTNGIRGNVYLTSKSGCAIVCAISNKASTRNEKAQGVYPLS
jgi:hypothetical protein